MWIAVALASLAAAQTPSQNPQYSPPQQAPTHPGGSYTAPTWFDGEPVGMPLAFAIVPPDLRPLSAEPCLDDTGTGIDGCMLLSVADAAAVRPAQVDHLMIVETPCGDAAATGSGGFTMAEPMLDVWDDGTCFDGYSVVMLGDARLDSGHEADHWGAVGTTTFFTTTIRETPAQFTEHGFIPGERRRQLTRRGHDYRLHVDMELEAAFYYAVYDEDGELLLDDYVLADFRDVEPYSGGVSTDSLTCEQRHTLEMMDAAHWDEFWTDMTDIPWQCGGPGGTWGISMGPIHGTCDGGWTSTGLRALSGMARRSTEQAATLRYFACLDARETADPGSPGPLEPIETPELLDETDSDRDEGVPDTDPNCETFKMEINRHPDRCRMDGDTYTCAFSAKLVCAQAAPTASE